MADAPVLHYIHDPLCGWCYGAAPLVAAARGVTSVEIHGGGMMCGPRRQRVTQRLREFVMDHDQRIAQLTGQAFGAAYIDELLRDETTVLDSAPPIAATLAADRLGRRGLDLLTHIQRAHFVEGRRISNPDVLVTLAIEIGLDADRFVVAFQSVQGDPTQAHIEDSLSLLTRIGGRGFPSFALELHGQLWPVDGSRYFGRPKEWAHWLTARIHAAVGA